MKPESISATCNRMLALPLMLGLACIVPSANAQTFGVVHNFKGSDGAYPLNGLMAHGKILYGVASSGGATNNGVVFKINASGGEIVLHNFAGGADGANPQGALVRDASGNLYGTTTAGSASGLGTVFMVTGKKESVLYSFAGGTDGANPQAGLALDAAGNLYGTTVGGGANGNGTVFRLAPSKTQSGPWTESVLYSFGTGTDGAIPIAGVSLDAADDLYGTTSAGGAYGYGTVFQLTPGPVWKENILHNFQNAADGAVPYAGLISDKTGNFYGAATEGGTGGGGTTFELSPSNGNWIYTVLYSVPGWGISGSFRDLLLDASGNLFGTTHCDGGDSSGTIYELSPSGGTWTYTLLYTFTGGGDGLYSFSNLALKQGSLYGTTAYGGSQGAGVVFEMTP
jgi:uncharacterized repeat protein (TIGR03803 family)